jgi:hypothetical protein
MQTVFSEALLARLRTHRDDYGVRSDDHNDSSPRLVVTLEQPVSEIYALLQVSLETEQTSGCYPDTGGGLGAPESPPVKLATVTGSDAGPLNSDPIEPGLALAISQMPAKLQRWMLAPPVDPPRWRRHESDGERAHREALEDLGGWVEG